jgi:cephalosporin hydroxylase
MVETQESLATLYSRLSHLCDKGTVHTYIDLYEQWLIPYRNRPITIIEIGVLKGGSVLLWSRYFTHPDTRIVGVDIQDRSANVAKLTDDPRIELVTGNSADPVTTQALPEADIVIDDGSHEPVNQIATFKHLFPKLRAGGLYVIEDLKSAAAASELMNHHPFAMYSRQHLKMRADDLLLVART